MKALLRSIFIETLKGDVVEIILGILLWVVTILVVVLIFSGCYYLIDSSFLPKQTGKGVITEKYIIPAYTTTTNMMVGKIMVPQTQYHPTRYMVKIKVGNLSDDVSIKQCCYTNMDIGDRKGVDYVIGRISNKMYIKEI